MGFRELGLRRAYDSGAADEDVLCDFYIPALECATSYDRLAGFFSSGALAVAARGIAGLIRSQGRMRIVASPLLTEADIAVLGKSPSTDSWDELIGSVVEAALDLSVLADEIARDHVRALAFMLAEGYLEIRLVVPTADGKRGDGLFHQKVGVMRDEAGELLSFSGSINETAAGWLDNIEEFKVFRGWEPGERDFLNHDTELFARYWNLATTRARAVPLPHAARERLLRQAPDSIEELDLEALRRRPHRKKVAPSFKLRDYQSRAVQAWFDHDCHGILEMATGTGKTKTAVAALDRLEQEDGSQLCVVTAPFQHIAVQWAKDLGGRDPLCLFQESDWRKALADLASRAKLGLVKHAYVCAVQNTAMTPDFLAAIARMSEGFARCVFIGDEVHGLGAPEMKKALAGFYTHRLGLSATPQRWFDDEGSEALTRFFGGVCYTFGIREALDWRDPETGLSALCPYRYYPIFVTLDGAELEEYDLLTEKLAKFLGRDDDPDAQKQLEMLLFKRAAIVKEAGQKITALAEIVGAVGDVSHGLVYCHSTPQMLAAMNVLGRHDVRYHRFTGSEGTLPEDQYGGVSEREAIIRSLDEGDVDVLVAMKCLDEGVDVPSARLGVILASSGNPREFIQRRGRLLRRSPGKDAADIYDVVVTPSIRPKADQRLKDLEHKIFGKELVRIDDFAQTAMNALDVRTAVIELMTKLT